MSGAVAAVQAALVAALRASAPLTAELTGIYDGPPPRAAFPYLAIGSSVSGDWSFKGGRGREHRLSLTVWDDGAGAARLHRLMAACEDAIEAIPEALDGHRLASIAFLRSRVLRDADGPWAGSIEYRARTVEG